MKYLEDTTKHIDVIDEARINYLIAYPVYTTQTFEAMVAFMRQQLQNKVPTVRSLGVGAAVTCKQPPKKVVVASMDTVTDLLLSVVKRLDRAEKALALTKANPQNVVDPNIIIPNPGKTQKPKGNMYCFCHGYNISRIGVDCKVMIGDASYTTA